MAVKITDRRSGKPTKWARLVAHYANGERVIIAKLRHVGMAWDIAASSQFDGELTVRWDRA